MTYPKMKHCPKCKAPVACYTYDSGTSRVECDRCHHIGPCGNKRQAIREWNERAAIVASDPAYHGDVDGDCSLA